MVKQFIAIVACTILIFICPYLSIAGEVAQVVEPKDSVSVAATQTFLTMVDNKEYEQSWEIASTYFKSLVTKEQWLLQVAAVRNPLGEYISRELNTSLYQKTLPGAPDGEYYVSTFNTVFKNKRSAIETVTVMKDNDGQWRLVGYFIR